MPRTLTLLSALLLAAGQALAQDQAAEAAPEATLIQAPTLTVAFPDEEAQRVADLLTGTWSSASPIDGSGATVVLSAAPVVVEGLPGVLYAEMSRSDDLANPYRQVLLQLYRYKDGLRLRTLEFRDTDTRLVVAGTSHVPDRFPASIPPDALYATIDIDLTASGDGFTGQSPYQYPTTVSNAVQMTSSITIEPGRLITGDTGYAADGSIAWGGDGGMLTFSRTEELVAVQRWSDGLVQINFAAGQGDPVADGDMLAVHYTGRLSTGDKFDSSRDRGEPFRYRVPGRLIPGWLRGTQDLRVGDTRKLIIPPELGYGSQGNQRIPANSTLVFDIECVHIERAPEETAPAEPMAEPAAEQSGAEGGH
jgi:peptidylprolyl isomerase